ncbi:MAG: hypothetical protein AAF436_07835 [Myxococcota bacterium]
MILISALAVWGLGACSSLWLDLGTGQPQSQLEDYANPRIVADADSCGQRGLPLVEPGCGEMLNTSVRLSETPSRAVVDSGLATRTQRENLFALVPLMYWAILAGFVVILRRFGVELV